MCLLIKIYSMFLLQIVWKYYYSRKSSADHATLYQLRNVMHRTNVVSDPKNNYNACDDFYTLVIECHIIAVAMEILKMADTDHAPDSSDFPGLDTIWMELQEKSNLLEAITNRIVDSLSLNFNNYKPNNGSSDKVRLYGTQLLSLGCFYLEYSDAIKEGDGIRVLRCWRYLLPMFISSRHKNYAAEALNLLLQHNYVLSPRGAHKLIWCRFINVSGQPGHNIPTDLHMEHLN